MNDILQTTEQKLKSTISALQDRLATIIATGAHPSLLKGIEVMYYEAMTPLSQVANIKAPDATMLIVTPFDNSINKDIVEALHKSSLGLNPVDEGNQIRIMVPPITAEKRTIFVKDAKEIGEDARISVRNVRQDANKKVRANEELSENEQRLAEEEIQKLVDRFNKEIEEIIKAKIDALTNI